MPPHNNISMYVTLNWTRACYPHSRTRVHMTASLLQGTDSLTFSGVSNICSRKMIPRWLRFWRMVTSVRSWDSCLLGNRSLSITFTATGLAVWRFWPEEQGGTRERGEGGWENCRWWITFTECTMHLQSSSLVLGFKSSSWPHTLKASTTHLHRPLRTAPSPEHPRERSGRTGWCPGVEQNRDKLMYTTKFWKQPTCMYM